VNLGLYFSGIIFGGGGDDVFSSDVSNEIIIVNTRSYIPLMNTSMNFLLNQK
jgi:hypothetical protein